MAGEDGLDTLPKLFTPDPEPARMRLYVIRNGEILLPIHDDRNAADAKYNERPNI